MKCQVCQDNLIARSGHCKIVSHSQGKCLGSNGTDATAHLSRLQSVTRSVSTTSSPPSSPLSFGCPAVLRLCDGRRKKLWELGGPRKRQGIGMRLANYHASRTRGAGIRAGGLCTSKIVTVRGLADVFLWILCHRKRMHPLSLGTF